MKSGDFVKAARDGLLTLTSKFASSGAGALREEGWDELEGSQNSEGKGIWSSFQGMEWQSSETSHDACVPLERKVSFLFHAELINEYWLTLAGVAQWIEYWLNC